MSKTWCPVIDKDVTSPTQQEEIMENLRESSLR